MAYLTVDDAFDLFIAEIRARFPDTPIEFTGKRFPDHPELWAYVLDKKALGQVKAFCRGLEQRPTDPPLSVAIRVKPWSGPWPGGESIEAITQKRLEFLKRHRKLQHHS